MFERVRPAALHGGLLHDELAELGIVAADVLDLSVNVNPYGPCPAVLDAIESAPLERYPDPEAMPARRAIAECIGIPDSRVVIGNGAVDLLWGLVRALLRAGDTVLVVEPAFSELRRAAVHAGARTFEFRTVPDNDFAVDLRRLSDSIRRCAPKSVYLCSPANPSGHVTPLAALKELAAAHPHVTFIVDVSFASLSSNAGCNLEKTCERIVWVRSLTKDFAIPGLRVGYAVAPAAVVERLQSGRPPWSINALAQAAAIAAMSPEARAFVDQSRARLLADRVRLTAALTALGLATHRSETPYLLADLGSNRSATSVRDALLARHAVLVRDGTSFGLPHHVRICAGPEARETRLIHALYRELQA